MIKIVLIVMAAMSLISFIVFGIDKAKAKAGAWRISEAALFLLAICGGGVGAFLGMKVFRHKTQHTQFVIGIPAIMIIQLIALGILIWRTRA